MEVLDTLIILASDSSSFFLAYKADLLRSPYCLPFDVFRHKSMETSVGLALLRQSARQDKTEIMDTKIVFLKKFS